MPIEDEKCRYCGSQAEKYKSGTPICWSCWYWVKLDHPAATHWARVAEEFLSNVDFYDLTKYLPACDLTADEIHTLLDGARRVLEHSRATLAGPPRAATP